MTIQLSEAAQAPGLPLVTTLDDEQYERLDLIVARPIGGGPARLYCLARDWDRTPAGRISQLVFLVESQQQQIEILARRADAADRARDLERQIETLRNENEELRADLARRYDRSAPPAPSIPQRQATVSPALTAIESELVACPVVPCDRTFGSAHALRVHIGKSHPEILIATVPPPPAEPVTYPCPQCDRVFESQRAATMHRTRTHGRAAPASDDDAPFVCAACHSDAFTRDLHEPTICIRCARSLPRDWAA